MRKVEGKWKQQLRGLEAGGAENFTTALETSPVAMGGGGGGGKEVWVGRKRGVGGCKRGGEMKN